MNMDLGESHVIYMQIPTVVYIIIFVIDIIFSLLLIFKI